MNNINNNINIENYIEKAEYFMHDKDFAKKITTSKIRDLLSKVNELYNDIILVKDEILDESYVEAIRHLKIKMIYDAGRDKQNKSGPKRPNYNVKNKLNNTRNNTNKGFNDYEGSLEQFFKETGLLAMVDKIGDSRENFLLYCKYFEALVAYHKFYGGKE